MAKPSLCGWFNFISYKPDEYNIQFIPFGGDVAVFVAKGLTREQMEKLRTDLNDCLEEFKEEISS